ncbi:MAG TPA: nickel-dependent lactate racemase [Pyrinomonadaceae bacterium]|jgi:nickel-dependent lactate racemase|nr:nickel-dependent lactate racemase [Pyrinomonadaceae bacterium]
MQNISLRYGSGSFPFKYDAERFEVIVPSDSSSESLADSALDAAFDNPIGLPLLEEIVRPTDNVLIVVPDATRAAGVERIVSVYLRRLTSHGLANKQISFLIGGGIHRPPTQDEIRAIVGVEATQKFAVYPHDANDHSMMVELGTTRRGTPVELNRRLVEADQVLVVGGITFHYFAGFSGGRKAILPGCASERAIQSNHLLSFDTETMNKRVGVASGLLEGNAVHEDMEEAVRFLQPSFLVNSVLNERKEIVALYTGDWRTAHRRGCDEYAAAHSISVPERRQLVIVSVGGAPSDINMIQSHKAMEHASGVLEEGGTMVALAECSQGLGRDDFHTWFVTGGSRATAEMLLRNYKINGQTAWSLRKKTERFRILLVSSLAAEVVQSMGMEPHRTLDSAMAAVTTAEPGYIIPGGLTTLPHVSVFPPPTPQGFTSRQSLTGI